MLTAFVLISAEPKDVADLATALAEVEGVAEAYSTAGDADIVAIVRVQHHDELAEVVTTRIARLRASCVPAPSSPSGPSANETWPLWEFD